MSMQSTPDNRRTFGPPSASRTEAQWNPISGGKVGDHLIASLATGLRSAYEAKPRAEIPDAFVELIVRLQAAENGGR